MVNLGRKNYLLFGSDQSMEEREERCCIAGLNVVEPESYFRYALDVITDWPINRVSEPLPWHEVLPTE